MNPTHLLLFFTFLTTTLTLPTFPFPFHTAGPSRILNGQTEGITDSPVAGAINRLLPHPTNPNILYAASVNGGIWKTTTAYSALPVWIPLTDHLPSGSIGAMQFDYSDLKFETIIAGVGGASSLGLASGLNVGLYLTQDAGISWRVMRQLEGFSVFGVAKYGEKIVACARRRGFGEANGGGVFLSLDGGESFEQLAFFRGFGCTDIVTNPRAPDNFILASMLGIFETEDGGETWDDIIRASEFEDYQNARLSLHVSETDVILYGGVLDDEIQEVFRAEKSLNGDWSYVIVDAPVFRTGINESDDDEDIHLTPERDQDEREAGGQGGIHFSIAADPESTTIFYACGDRQDLPNSENETTNAIGATDYTGVCFKIEMVDDALDVIPLTHKFTNNGSAPHADSRNLRFDALNNLVESDDGGVYRRIDPRSTSGDWFSVNGNLQVLESHSAVLFDSEEDIFLTGNQDVGTTISFSSKIWDTVLGGDGGVVQSYTTPDRQLTTAYSTFPFLAALVRLDFNHTSGDPPIASSPPMILPEFNVSISQLGDILGLGFYNPYYVNRFTSERIFVPIKFDGFSFESFDGANTMEFLDLSTDGQLSTIKSAIYGGMRNGQENPDLLIATGDMFLVIREFYSEESSFITSFPPSQINFPSSVDISVHPDNWYVMAVLFKFGEVALSQDAGTTWTVLPQIDDFVVGTPESKQTKIVLLPTQDVTIVVSGLRGIFAWSELSGWFKITGIPRAYISDMRYSNVKDVLYFGTLGRGVWYINNTIHYFESMAAGTTEVSPDTETISSTYEPNPEPTSSETTSAESETDQPVDVPEDIYKTLLFVLIPALIAVVFICVTLVVLFVRSKANSNRYSALEQTARYAD